MVGSWEPREDGERVNDQLGLLGAQMHHELTIEAGNPRSLGLGEVGFGPGDEADSLIGM